MHPVYLELAPGARAHSSVHVWNAPGLVASRGTRFIS